METLILKAKTREEVAAEYAICVKTLNRWLKKAKIILPPGLIKPFHLQIIYEAFGTPRKLKIA
jgi:hypothetical protein